LARRGLLEARRGPGGGYRLTAPAADVTLAQIAAALGAGEERRGRCVLEERSCRGDAPCALHTAAVEADACLGRALRSLTLSDMAFSVRGRMEAL
jgi:Rrf2 family iron-sulfur cluster assembly transcriptional regulator